MAEKRGEVRPEDGAAERAWAPTDAPAQAGAEKRKGVRHVGARHWLLLAAGSAAALGVLFITPVSYLVKLIVAFIHEAGHSVTGWLFGYPSVPTIDFFYGGGVTIQWGRQWWLQALVLLLLGYLIYRYRHNLPALLGLGALGVLYGLLALTSAHQVAILSSGHLAELVFAGYLLYRVFKGNGIPGTLERAFLAAFILLEDLRFSYMLITSPAVRQNYEISGVLGFKMDFSCLAADYLSISVEWIAFIFMLCCLITPVLTFLLFRYRDEAVRPALDRLAHWRPC